MTRYGKMSYKIENILKRHHSDANFFKAPEGDGFNADTESVFPRLPNAMKNQIKTQIDESMNEVLAEILSKY
jgi:hypothetical protein